MGTLREEIYSILETDAKVNNVANLGGMIGKYSTSPYGVYFLAPPSNVAEDVGFPILTYYFSVQEGLRPRDIFLNLTAWSVDLNFETILNRVFALLNDSIVTATDFTHLMMKFNWCSTEMFDDDFKVYYQTQRYRLKAWKT